MPVRHAGDEGAIPSDLTTATRGRSSTGEPWSCKPVMRVRLPSVSTTRYTGCSSTAECWSHIPAAGVRLPPARRLKTRGRSSTGECWLGRPATRVRLPPVPRSSRPSFVSFSGPGYVWRRWLTVYEYLGEFDSRQGRYARNRCRRWRKLSSVPAARLILGCVIQWKDTSLAPMQWGFESPPVHPPPLRSWSNSEAHGCNP